MAWTSDSQLIQIYTPNNTLSFLAGFSDWLNKEIEEKVKKTKNA